MDTRPTERKLAEVEFPQDDRPSFLQAANDGGIQVRNQIPEDFRPARGADAFSQKLIFHRQRDTVQCTAVVAAADLSLGLARGRQSCFATDSDVGM